MKQTPPRSEEDACVNNQEFVLETTVRWTYLEEKLRNALKTNAKFGANKRIESIGAGQGFMSSMGRLYPNWTIHNESLPKSFIVKIPSIASSQKYINSTNLRKEINECVSNSEDEQRENQQNNMEKIHNVEVGFYEINESLSRKLKVPRAFVMERFERNISNGLLVLEDLFDAHVIPIYENVTVEEATQVIDEIAEMHAFSLRNDTWLKLPHVQLRDIVTLSGQSEEVFLKITELTVELDPDRLKDRLEKLHSIYSRVFDLDFEQDLYKKMGMKPVLVHGDLWSSNIMWRDNNGSRKLAALIDWQLVHPGCPSQDLARFICSVLTGEDRRKHWESLLERYYMKISEKLENNVPFTFKQLKESFIRLLPFHMSFLLPTLGPLILHHIKQTVPEQYDEIRLRMAEKAIALLDDIFFYDQSNLRSSGSIKA